MTDHRIVPFPGCAHVYPCVSAPGVVPEEYGPCTLCGRPYEPSVLYCAACSRRIPPGVRECQTPRCMEQAAALVAEWIANGVFDGIDPGEWR